MSAPAAVVELGDAGHSTAAWPMNTPPAPLSAQFSNWHLEPGAVHALLVDNAQKSLVRIDAGRLRSELRRARRLVLKADVNSALHIVDRLDSCIARGPADAVQGLRADVDFVRAMSWALQDDSVGALRAACAVLRTESRRPARRAYAAAVCHFAHWRLRDVGHMYCLDVPRPSLPYRRRHLVPAVITRSIEAAVEFEQLRLASAKRLALDALDMAESLSGPHSSVAALPATLVAQVLYEQGCLSEANAILRNRLAAINACGILECSLRAYSVLTGIALHRGQEARALALLQEAEDLGLERAWPRLVAATLYERVRILLRAERLSEAQLCAQRLEKIAPRCTARRGSNEFDTEHYRRLIQAQLAAAGSPAAAVVAFRQLHHSALESQDLYAAMGLALQLAVCLDSLGDTREADDLFQRSLGLGRFAGLYQLFVDGGQKFKPLLTRAYEQVRRPGAVNRDLLPYIESVLAQVGGRRLVCQPEKAMIRSSNCLSSRECDILELVAGGLSNKRIAHALTIAPETVKSHVKRIFIKLDVKTRAEAVSRASVLGSIRVRTPGTGTA